MNNSIRPHRSATPAKGEHKSVGAREDDGWARFEAAVDAALATKPLHKPSKMARREQGDKQS